MAIHHKLKMKHVLYSYSDSVLFYKACRALAAELNPFSVFVFRTTLRDILHNVVIWIMHIIIIKIHLNIAQNNINCPEGLGQLQDPPFYLFHKYEDITRYSLLNY